MPVTVPLAIGGWFASAVISNLVTSAKSYICKRKQKGMKAQLERLERAVPEIQSIVLAVESGQGQITDALKDWLWKLKGALYEADDVLDELEYLQLKEDVEAIVTKEHKVRGPLSHFKTKVVQFTGACKTDPTLKRLRGVVKKLDEVAVNVGVFLTVASSTQKQCENQQADIIADRETSSQLAARKLWGRESESEEIIGCLLKFDSDDRNCIASLISIVGIGGVGKTTLAQLVYNDNRIEKSFNLKLWIYVSTSFNVKDLTRAMVNSATKLKPQVDSLSDLQDALKSSISSCRFFLVLDDVWNDDNLSKWEELFSPLRYGRKGSKILLTTRMEQVAKMAGKALGRVDCGINLKGLEGDDYISLFNHHAFAGFNQNSYKKLQSIGRKITKRLGGLPLAAKIVGGMLNSNLNVEHWNNILNSSSISEGIMSVLRLSYHHLPDHLRSCFSYCSIFPQAHEFHKDELVHMWMAAGLIRQSQSQGERLESIGARYFDDLQKKSFLEFSFGTYVIHHLLHELARSESEGDCFRLVDDQPVENIPVTVRHLFVQTNEIDSLGKLEKFKNLRTLVLFSDQYDPEHAVVYEKMFSALKRVRVLSMSVNGMTALTDAIGDLQHLRFLKVDLTMDQLSKSLFCRLYHLQVLALKIQGDRCISLEGLDNLIRLRHLMVPWNKIVIAFSLGRLSSLQELKLIANADCENKLGELKALKELRELEIEKLENAQEYCKDINDMGLSDKKHLRVLKLEWSLNSPNGSPELDKQVVDCFQPHPDLKKLTIVGYRGVGLANWMVPGLIQNLEYVELVNCLGWERLPSLGELPYLKFLYFKNMPSIKQVNFGGGFPQLKVLEINRLEQWEDWSCSGEDIVQWCPVLNDLRIGDCPKLKRLPSLPLSLRYLELENVGLTTLPTLQPGHNSDCCSTSRSPCRSSLYKLSLKSCKNTSSLPPAELFGRLVSLEYLTVQECPSLTSLGGLHALHHLSHLEIRKCPNLVREEASTLTKEVVFKLPVKRFIVDQMSLVLAHPLRNLTSVQEVEFDDCSEHQMVPHEVVEWLLQNRDSLKGLSFSKAVSFRFLPGMIHLLSSLEDLRISNACKLEQLPELPPSLKVLCIFGSSGLFRFLYSSKHYWLKISHMPHVYIQ